MKVTLTLTELQVAAFVGSQRRLRALKNNREDGSAGVRGLWEIDIEGAAGEMAVAKGLNLYWNDSPYLDYAGDVLSYQVRSTDVPTGHLFVHPEDADEKLFILAIGSGVDWQIAGYMLGMDAKHEKFWSGERLARPCFMVPQEKLISIETLAN